MILSTDWHHCPFMKVVWHDSPPKVKPKYVNCPLVVDCNIAHKCRPLHVCKCMTCAELKLKVLAKDICLKDGFCYLRPLLLCRSRLNCLFFLISLFLISCLMPYDSSKKPWLTAEFMNESVGVSAGPRYSNFTHYWYWCPKIKVAASKSELIQLNFVHCSLVCTPIFSLTHLITWFYTFEIPCCTV